MHGRKVGRGGDQQPERQRKLRSSGSQTLNLGPDLRTVGSWNSNSQSRVRRLQGKRLGGEGGRGRERIRLWRATHLPNDGPPLYSVISGEPQGPLKRTNILSACF